MKNFRYLIFIFILILSLTACEFTTDTDASINITNGEELTLKTGETVQLTLDGEYDGVQWICVDSAVTVDESGLVSALEVGEARVKAQVYLSGVCSDYIDITVISGTQSDSSTDIDTDPYENMSAAEFYASYTPAKTHKDALYRSQHGFLSGSLTVPEQMHTVATNRPTYDGKFIKNSKMTYTDGGNTYIVCDSEGNERLRVHRDGAYITLEEVAAYMYAFGGSGGSLPANYVSKTSAKPQSNIWGKYLRLNHSHFSGDTYRYPYEPKLPNINGSGGSLQYYEMDIGTTGTVTPSRVSGAYNNGSKIIRGAARIVYARYDLNRNGKYDNGEIYLFYTFNHYNDFTEYLNYYGGWGEVFGNITGGGVFDSDTSCNPTLYVPVYYGELDSVPTVAYFDFKKYRAA